jgi:erythromycin esterase
VGAAHEDIRRAGRPLRTADDLDPLLERVGDARIVCLGEASHGTAEYYRWRDAITRRLVTEHGFGFVAVEGDWPDCRHVDRIVNGRPGTAARAGEALAHFDRWPEWMWRNAEVLDLVDWLRRHNDATGAGVGFYGLDVYSLWDSMRAVLDYVRTHEPEHVDTVSEAFRCFEPYGEDPQQYARATRLIPTTCEDEVVAVLRQLLSDAAPRDAEDAASRFDAEQNALVAAGAERYYRTMAEGGSRAWNVRDTHMVETLDRLLDHHGPGSRAVVWAHNTHVGDARATDMADRGAINLGQLARERHGEGDVALVGFGSHSGTVVAGAWWGAPGEVLTVPPARRGSVEALLHDAGRGDALLLLDGAGDWGREELLHRAIGVVYRPEEERWGNYVPTVLARRYDAFCYLDRTRALHPLDGQRVGPQESPRRMQEAT